MAALAVITPPATILQAAEIISALDLDAATDAGLLSALAAAAQSALDGATGDLGRAIGPQTLELRLDDWWHHWRGHHFAPVTGVGHVGSIDGLSYHSGHGIKLPYPPYISMVSITYLDENGAGQTLDPARYQVIGAGEGPSEVIPAYLTTWPAVQGSPECIKIRYLAGYEICPPILRQAMLLMVRSMFNTSQRDMAIRSETVDGVGSVTYDHMAESTLTGAVESLVRRYRVPSL